MARLSFSIAPTGRLLARASDSHVPLTSVVFAAEGLEVSAPMCTPVCLAWDTYGHIDHVMDAKPARDGWTVVPYTVTRGGVPIGVAVQVGGRYEQATAEIRSKTSTVWRRFNESFGQSLSGRSLPVLTRNFATPNPEYPVLWALCGILHDRPYLRARLADRDRVVALARELNEKPLALFASGTGMGRDSVDIHTALVTLGYTHPYTRPLAKGTTPSVEEVTSQVVAALASNPYRVDRTTDLRQVQQIVSREYVDVEPWPFAALIQE